MKICEQDRTLFMKYALPCAGTLVKRGSITQEKWDELIDIVKNEGKIPDGAERIFKVAFAACSLIALDRKTEIDKGVIHEYYLFGHDKVIDKRYGEMGDFDPDMCRIRPGIVKSFENGFVTVENSSGTGKYRADYCKVAKGDLVTTHWNFIVEKISEEMAEKMKKQKIELKVI